MATELQSELAKRLAGLRKEYLSPTDQRDIKSTEEALRKAAKQAKLAERHEVRLIIEEAVSAITDINFLLANDEDLTEPQRRELFAERRVHKFWLERLDGERAKATILAIAEVVDNIKPVKK